MIKINKLNTSYKNFKIENLNLNLDEGKITFLLGKNGSGKTTLIKSILNLKPYSGEVTFNGKPINEVRDDLAVVFADGGMYNFLTGNENLKYFDVNQPLVFEFDSKILKREIKTYSTGQSRKLMINIGLKDNKKFVICDEISSGLDYDSIKALKRKLIEYKKEGAVVLLTGHQFEFYNDIIDDIVVLKNGEIKYSGCCKALLEDIGIYANIIMDFNNPIAEDVIKKLNGQVSDNSIKIYFKCKKDYDSFKLKYINNIDAISYNLDKVGIIYEKYLD